MTQSPIPKVAAIHDLSCFGRAALSVVIPILSTMGIQVCPLPTALYSSHGRFPGYSSLDLTDQIGAIISHWKELHIGFDAIYSGFLSSSAQIDIFSEFILDFSREEQLVVIDPVLGDHGNVYGITSNSLISRMREYICIADAITPNLTEAALLLGEPYRSDICDDELQEWLVRLAEFGPSIVILTSAPVSGRLETHIGVRAYHRQDNQFWDMATERTPANYPGTGDAFTSIIVGSLLQNIELPVALQRAIQFLSTGIILSSGCAYPEEEGILLEQILQGLVAPGGHCE